MPPYFASLSYAYLFRSHRSSPSACTFKASSLPPPFTLSRIRHDPSCASDLLTLPRSVLRGALVGSSLLARSFVSAAETLSLRPRLPCASSDFCRPLPCTASLPLLGLHTPVAWLPSPLLASRSLACLPLLPSSPCESPAFAFSPGGHVFSFSCGVFPLWAAFMPLSLVALVRSFTPLGIFFPIVSHPVLSLATSVSPGSSGFRWSLCPRLNLAPFAQPPLFSHVSLRVPVLLLLSILVSLALPLRLCSLAPLVWFWPGCTWSISCYYRSFDSPL